MANIKKKSVLVVLGGNSREREISILTGKACAKAIKDLNYKVKIFDPKKNNFENINKKEVDIIFNALHGREGEDGIAQSYFEYLKIPYTHSGIISSMNAMDKSISKKIFIKNKILTPRYIITNLLANETNKLRKKINKNKIYFPIVIKPLNEGSSIGVNICENFKQLNMKFKKLKKRYSELMIEEFIAGQEIQVAVLNTKALGAIELKPKREFYDYKAKYLKSAKTIHVMPAQISKKDYKRILQIAEMTHLALGCRGVSRCDFKFHKNKFYLLEINTQPGMTNLSLVPEIAKYCGLSFKNLINKILKDASINK